MALESVEFLKVINLFYKFEQINGQRVFGPPFDWSGPPPKRGSEIFISRIPFDFYEDELLPVLEAYGQIYELRTMVNFDNTLRGFAFCKFATPEQAQSAIGHLNKFLIRGKILIRATLSMEYSRLYIGNIDRCSTRKDLLVKFSMGVKNLIDVVMFPDPKDPTRNRGFAFLEFKDHRSAALARRKILNNREMISNKSIYVDWAKTDKKYLDLKIINQNQNQKHR